MNSMDKRKLLTKEEFLQQYTLKRASARQDGLAGDGAAEEAIKAWKLIREEMLKKRQVKAL